MKKMTGTIGTPVIVLLLILSGCTYSARTAEDGPMTSRDISYVSYREADAVFLMNAAGSYLSGIQLGRIAEGKSGTEGIKEMARVMEKEKIQSMDRLKTLAQRKLILIPLDVPFEDQDVIKSILKKKGAEFDQAYCSLVVKSHRRIIAEFEQGMNQTEDKDIREWAVSSLPQLRSQLLMAIECSNKIDKN